MHTSFNKLIGRLMKKEPFSTCCIYSWVFFSVTNTSIWSGFAATCWRCLTAATTPSSISCAMWVRCRIFWYNQLDNWVSSHPFNWPWLNYSLEIWNKKNYSSFGDTRNISYNCSLVNKRNKCCTSLDNNSPRGILRSQNAFRETQSVY